MCRAKLGLEKANSAEFAEGLNAEDEVRWLCFEVTFPLMAMPLIRGTVHARDAPAVSAVLLYLLRTISTHGSSNPRVEYL